MLKIFMAIALASCLFITGGLSLLNIKNQAKQKAPVVAIDYNPSCNETTYPDIVSQADESLLRAQSNTPDHNDPFDLDPTLSFAMIAEGETLHSILRPKKVSELEIARLGIALKPYLLARDLAPGDFYWLRVDSLNESQAIVKEMIIKKVDSNRVPILYTLKRSSDTMAQPTFSIDVKEAAIREELALISITVKGTLYQSFNEIAFGSELMQRLMSVFAWTMKIPEEVALGDSIDILVNKKYIQNELISYGKIESVFYRQKARTLFATFFSSSDGKIRGYYDELGKSLEREFSLSPVHEVTATSEQSWRVHPIRNKKMRHNGIDYRGTIGTDFFSIGDGEITEKRFDKNVGNMIRIKHNYGVYSEYFHADELVSSLQVGQRVKRGEKLGTIGRTGRLCTGPHLHMGLYRLQGDKRKFIQFASLGKTLKSMPSLTGNYLTEFKTLVAQKVAVIEQKKKGILAASQPKAELVDGSD